MKNAQTSDQIHPIKTGAVRNCRTPITGCVLEQGSAQILHKIVPVPGKMQFNTRYSIIKIFKV